MNLFFTPMTVPYNPLLSNMKIQNMTAVAQIKGSPQYPNIRGRVIFKDVPNGTEVYVEVLGLPPYTPAQNGVQPIGPFGFHIHKYGVCEVGDPNSPFKSTDGHWNPTNQPHGNHAGDFPVLFSNNGYTRMSFFTNKFKVSDILNKSVVIHQNPDDYRTQPAGNSGKPIACGVVKPYYM